MSTGYDGDFFEFTAIAESLVEGSDHGVEGNGGEGGHVENAADLVAAAFAEAFALLIAALVRERGNTDKRGELFVREQAEFGQFGDKGRA